MPGRKYQAGSTSYRYSINGQEKESELNENITTALYWEYDSRIGRRWNVDPVVKNWESPYATFTNNPIKLSDINGDSAWATKTSVTDAKGNITETWTFHAEIAVMDITGCECNAVGLLIKSVKAKMEEEFNKTSTVGIGPNGDRKTELTRIFKAKINIREVLKMNEVKNSDHLIVLVDNVTGKSAKGGSAGGLGATFGKIAYVKGGLFYTAISMIKGMIHEFGHNMGLSHTFDNNGNDGIDDTKPDDLNNFMSYTNKSFTKLQFTTGQIIEMTLNAYNGKVNNGSNSTTATKSQSSFWWHISSNEEPWDGDIKKGEKIPLPLKN